MVIINNASKREELAQLQALQLDIDNLLQDPNIDEDIKTQVRQDIALTQDTIHADKMSNRDARRYALGVYAGIKKKLAGEPGYSESMVGGATKNMFGRYSADETAWMSNETLKQSAQEIGATTKPIQYDSINEPASIIHSFNPAEVTQVYRIAGSQPDEAQAIKDFAQYLTTALSGARNVLLNGGASLQDWKSEHTIEMVNEWLNKLRSVGTGSKEQLDQQILDMGQIVTQLQNSNVQSTFESYFAPWLEGFSETTAKPTSTGGRSFTMNGATVQHTSYPDSIIEDLIVKKGWYIQKGEDGNYYAYDKSGTPQTLESIIGVNPYVDSYQKGVFTDSKGRIYAGSLAPDPSGANDQFVKDLVAAGIDWESAVRKAHTNHYGSIVDGRDQGLGRYVDMSRFYKGTEGLKYQLPDDEKQDPLWWDITSLGKDNFVFEGNADVTTSGNVTGDQYLQQAGDASLYIDGVDDFDEEYAQSYFGGSGDNSGDINLKGLTKDPTFTSAFKYEPGKLSDAIITFAYCQLLWSHLNNLQKQDGLGDDEIQEIEDAKMEAFITLQKICPEYTKEVTAKGGESGQLGNIIWHQILKSEHIKPILKKLISDPKMQLIRSTVIEMFEKLDIPTNKKGGILKAQPGNSLEYLDNSQSSPVVRAAVREKYGDNVPFHALDKEQQDGIKLLMYSSLVDLTDILLGGSGHKVGRLVGPLASISSSFLDGAAASKLDMDTKDRMWLLGTDVFSAALSTIPFIQKFPKIKRLEYAKGAQRVMKGLEWAGISLGSVLAGMNAGPATEGLTKLFNGQVQLMTQEDWTAIANFTTGLASTMRGVSGIKYQNKSRQITPSDSEVWVDAIVDGKRQAVKVSKDKVQDINSGIHLASTRKSKAKDNLTSDLKAAEPGKEVSLHYPWWKFSGKINTKPVLEVTPEAASDMARRQSQTRIFRQSIETPRSKVGGSNARFSMVNTPYFGPVKGWHFAKINPTFKFVTTSAGKSIHVLEVDASEFKQAQQQFAKSKGQDINGAKMTEMGVTGYPDNTAAFLTKATDGKTDLIIVAKPSIEPTTSVSTNTTSSNKKGGRLKRLNQYLNK